MTVLRALAILIGLGGLAFWIFVETSEPEVTPPESEATASERTGTALVEVARPANLSANAVIGETLFSAKCASCHGPDAAGQDGVAPPLIHKIYEPSHHADEAFQRAAAVGVRQHHWRFGDMPPVEGLTRGDVSMIVAYIRELQRENGIN